MPPKMAMSKPCRDLFRCAFVFGTANRKERERIHEEWLGHLNVEECRQLMDYVWDRKYQALYMDRQEGVICKNLSRLCLNR